MKSNVACCICTGSSLNRVGHLTPGFLAEQTTLEPPTRSCLSDVIESLESSYCFSHGVYRVVTEDMDTDQQPLEELRSNSFDDKLPKLSLWMLMLWITLSAIGCVVAKWMSGGSVAAHFQDEGTNSALILMQFLGALSASIAIAEFIGLGALIFAWKKTSRVYLKHPGHWLVAIACTIYLVAIVSLLKNRIDQYAMSNYDWTATTWRIRQFFNSTWIVVTMSLIPLGLNLVAAYINRGIWRWTFGLMAFRYVASLILWVFHQIAFAMGATSGLSLGNTVNSVLLVCMILLLVYVTSKEAWQRVRRDWVHWLGVFACLALQVSHCSAAWLLL